MLRRRALIESLFASRPDDLLAVSSLGSPTWDLAAAGDDARNFGFIGAMGQAVPFALGLALAQPARRVVAVVGDGELLMSLGALATVASQAPANLAILALDNEVYGETGGQPTATAARTNLEQVARACGFEATCTARAQDDVEALRMLLLERSGPVFATAKIDPEQPPLAFPHSFDGASAMSRFREAVLDSGAR